MQTVLSRDHLQETLDKAEASAKKVCMVSDRRPAVVADSATEICHVRSSCGLSMVS